MIIMLFKEVVPEYKGTLTLKNSKVKVLLLPIFVKNIHLVGRVEDCRGQWYGGDPLHINKARGIIIDVC